MITLDLLIDDIIKRYENYNVIDCVYREHKQIRDDEITNIYFVFMNDNTDFYSLFEKNQELNIVNIIEESTSVVYHEISNLGKTFYVLTNDNYCIYFHIVKGIYEFPNIELLYKNVDALKRESDKDDNLVLSFNSFIYNINLAYRMEVDDNKYVSLSYITNAYSDLLKFLGNFYLRYSPNINCIHFDYNEVLRLMSEKKRNDFKQMVNLMKVDKTKECAKLMLWFIDDYINNLTINVLSRIDIDYYEFVKGLFIK